MSNDTGTETIRSDAPGADESLFGDAADDAAAEEQDANEETAQDPQDADDAGEQAGSPEDLKVVVSIKGGRATIGVQRPSSDPHIETFDDGDLAGLTQEVSAVIERARAKWEDEPKHPAHMKPAPPARRQPRRGQGAAQAGAAEGGADQQQPETLTQVFSQLQQRHHVLHVGPHPAFSPTPYGGTIGPDAAGDLRPRRARLLLEALQALREVVGEFVGPSSVLCTLSRHRAGSFKRAASRSIQEAVPRIYLRLPSVFLCMRSFLLPEVLLGSVLNSTVLSAPTARRQVTRPG